MASPKLSKPDLEDLIFGCKGEFSAEADFRFEAHLKRLEAQKQRCAKFIKNPRTLTRRIMREEPLWYGMVN